MDEHDEKLEYSVKNWADHQAYKHRNPPWIKLHRDILNDREIAELAPSAKWLLVCLWLFASEGDGTFRMSVNDIAFRLRQPAAAIAKDINKIQELQLVVYAGVCTAQTDAHTCMPEGETEGEGEQRREENIKDVGLTAKAAQPGDGDEILMAYPCAKREYHVVTRNELREVARDYGGQIDVFIELRKIRRYFETNKQKRITKARMPAFIDRWMKREINNPGGGTPPKTKGEQRKEANKMADAYRADIEQRKRHAGRKPDREVQQPSAVSDLLGTVAASIGATEQTDTESGAGPDKNESAIQGDTEVPRGT